MRQRVLIFYVLLVSLFFAGGCKNKLEKRYGSPDNQLERVLKNSGIEVIYSLNIDTTNKKLGFLGEALDLEAKKTYIYPGFCFIDKEILLINGSFSQIELPDTGRHIFKVVFSDDMYFNQSELKVVSNNVDSLQTDFDIQYLYFLRNPTLRNDSIYFQLNKPIKKCVVVADVFPVGKNDISLSDLKSTKNFVQIDSGRFSMPVKEFKMDGFNEYFFDVSFSVNYTLFYKGAKKGKLMVGNRNFPVRVNLLNMTK